MATQHNNQFRRLRLDIAVRVEPVQGRLVDDRGKTEHFTGWLDLVELLEAYRSGQSRDGVRSAPP